MHHAARNASFGTFAAFLLTACSVLPGSGGQGPRERAERPAPGAPPVAVRPGAERQCLTGLDRAGASFTPLSDRSEAQGCTNLGTVQLQALASDDHRIAVTNLGPVTCPVTQAFAGWTRFGVDRAARQILGTRVARIETFGSYACRNVAGTGRRSAHATAEAIDISGFLLADGRRISVRQDWNGGTASERRFLRTVQQSACKRFNVVLGPEYNAAHEDHFHLEGVIEGSSYCR